MKEINKKNEVILGSFRPEGQGCTVFYKIENGQAETIKVVFDHHDSIDYDGKGNVIDNA